MKHAIFGFTTPNLGDDVQAIAAALLLPKVDAYVDRDALDKVRFDEPHTLIMNSWFAIKRYTAVPHRSLVPHYFGHAVGRPELVNPTWLAEWRRHPFIGCRDLHSVDVLRQNGIDARFTGCLTTWMGRHFAQPAKREGVLIVDVPPAMESFIPDDVRQKAVHLTSETGDERTDLQKRFMAAAKLLDALRTAELVVTRRLHIALPCIGFGTPVTVYLGDDVKNRRRFSGSDALLQMVLHDGTKPLGPEWLEPAAQQPTAEMEAGFEALRAQLGATGPVERRWSSVAEFVGTFPAQRRHAASFMRQLLVA
ncbi:polysaccharide pyruvyl transferase family protein [uncultured Hyphomicrobium sp.]|uniref:polysaccharide pyruvyl transferase family protein n=1 Tax=uncultured Hyphomicrobium sp. TaxID=194373 RepID=UPI0025E864E4|nr:polysaccharide pyruvyl transferase family protein [uncultured Hyphomicrobium sp.]